MKHERDEDPNPLLAAELSESAPVLFEVLVPAEIYHVGLRQPIALLIILERGPGGVVQIQDIVLLPVGLEIAEYRLELLDLARLMHMIKRLTERKEKQRGKEQREKDDRSVGFL
jgi:hypothetical protein